MSTPILSQDHLGSLSQFAAIDRFTEDDGPSRGARRYRVYTGGGLEFEVHPDRAFDIGRTTYRGTGAAWLSPTRITAPGLVVNDGDAWLRTFGGGLLTTCGLDTIGDPSETDSGAHPLHGRVGAVPATVTRATADRDLLVLEAEVRQASVHGENLLLSRRITAEVGGSSFRISDTVTNEGYSDRPHMILYHCNLGWPLLGEDVLLSIPSGSVTEENAAARLAPEPWDRFTAPARDAESLLYRHHLDASSGRATATIANPRIGMSLAISFDTSTLPYLHQWKMMAPGQYLLGIEPSNSPSLAGRGAVEEAGALPVLRAGESVSYEVGFEFGATDV